MSYWRDTPEDIRRSLEGEEMISLYEVDVRHLLDERDALMAENLAPTIDAAHLTRQREFSRKTFGPGPRLKGVIEHISKELVEIEAQPQDITEWADGIILMFDGALRQGHQPQDIIDAVIAKQTKNESRTWPDYRQFSQDQAIEHVREEEK